MLFTEADIRSYFPQYTESGTLIVSTTAGGVYPLSGSRVSVYIILPDGTPKPYRVLFTDESGETVPLQLPAPPKSVSDQPPTHNNAPLPYATYRVSAETANYVPAVAERLAVFSGITARQPFRMIPLDDQSKNGPSYGEDVYIEEEPADLNQPRPRTGADMLADTPEPAGIPEPTENQVTEEPPAFEYGAPPDLISPRPETDADVPTEIPESTENRVTEESPAFENGIMPDYNPPRPETDADAPMIENTEKTKTAETDRTAADETATDETATDEAAAFTAGVFRDPIWQKDVPPDTQP